MKWKNSLLIALLALLLNNSHLQAQFVYPNDVCSGAMLLPVGNKAELSDSVFQQPIYADPVPSPIPNCTGTNVRYDIWYSFIATQTSMALVFENLGVYTLSYQLFTGNCGGLLSVVCNSSATNPNLTGLVPGQQYYLRTYVGSVINSGDVTFDYKLSLLSAPINDDCVQAALLPVNPVNSNFSNRFSNVLSTSALDVSCADNTGWTNYKDVWFKFIATSTVHSINIEAPTLGTRIVVYKGVPGSLTSMAGHQTTVSILTSTAHLTGLIFGETYYIRAGATTNATFKLGIMQGSPANDECANADTVSMSNSFKCENNFVVKRLGANNSTAPCPASSVSDTWYIFKATTANITVTCTGDDASNLNLGLLSGNCGALTCLVNSSSSDFTYNGLTVGNYYYLKAGGTSSGRLAFICISPAITNDECSGALPLTIKPYNQLRTNIGNNKGATQSLPGCQNASEMFDVWYRFTATDSACLITVDAAESNSYYFQVFSGDCAALNSIHCSSNNALVSGITERTERVSGLVAGNEYYVRYYSPSFFVGLFTIDINILPANDTCANAASLTPQTGFDYEIMQDNGILHATTSLPACAGELVTKDIWYSFIPTQNSVAIMSNRETGNNPNGTTVSGFQVYGGSCGALISMGCVQQGTALHKAQTFTDLLPGQRYYIRQYGNVSKSRFTIIEKPVNDEIAGAVKLTVAPANIQPMPSYSLHGATKQFGKICNAAYAFQHDVWFYFIAEGSSHTVGVNNFNSFWEEQNTGYTYRIEAFDGYASDSTSLAAKAISCGAGSLALNGLATGDTVYLRIASTAVAGNTSIFSIKVSNNQNIDEPAGALELTALNTYQYSLNTTGATQSLPAAGCLTSDFPDDDVWFKFTASATAKRIIAGYENRGITLQLFSGTPGNLTAITCSNNILVLPANLTNGTVYYVRAYSKANALAADFRIGLFGEDDPLANSCSTIACLGPNLVVNPRCETEYSYILPRNINTRQEAGRKLAEGWWSASYATPDTWNADYPYGEWGDVPGNAGLSKNKIPRSGKGMLGILLTTGGGAWQEYITGKLATPLVAGKTYLISFYVSIDKSSISKNAFNIGAYFSNDSIIGISTLPFEFTPHIATPPGLPLTEENSWRNVCGTFYADKPYSFITIGNFGAAALYASGSGTYIFVDDVVVAETNCATVPLSLLSFRGRTNTANQTELSWETAEEINTKNFVVEWRTDGTNFTAIGTVPAKGNAYNAYNFLHSTPAEGYNYYRLKMHDVDGGFTYSPIVRTGKQFSGNEMMVYPNPVSSVINITAQSDKDELVFFRLVNVEGKVVINKQILLKKGSNTFTWNVAQLSGGTYFITSTNKSFRSVQIIKQ
ncbi:MAG: T9SS type A sorting domain-containing protein [Rhizobacter sp.]|nr:T9SS type A sorting domain-containing protein [Ferruginibacter sp.]